MQSPLRSREAFQTQHEFVCGQETGERRSIIHMHVGGAGGQGLHWVVHLCVLWVLLI